MATTIGKGVSIQGTVHADEPIAISGTVKGDVYAANNAVTVEAEGRIEGSITGREITVRGALIGRLVATEVARLEVGSTVSAEVASPKLAIRDGATFTGRVEPARAEAAAIVAAYRQGA